MLGVTGAIEINVFLLSVDTSVNANARCEYTLRFQNFCAHLRSSKQGPSSESEGVFGGSFSLESFRMSLFSEDCLEDCNTEMTIELLMIVLLQINVNGGS